MGITGPIEETPTSEMRKVFDTMLATSDQIDLKDIFKRDDFISYPFCHFRGMII